jgi:hypothetical protein
MPSRANGIERMDIANAFNLLPGKESKLLKILARDPDQLWFRVAQPIYGDPQDRRMIEPHSGLVLGRVNRYLIYSYAGLLLGTVHYINGTKSTAGDGEC